MHSGNAAAMPPARKQATFSFCQTSRSVRITTAILVSNCIDGSKRRHFGTREGSEKPENISKIPASKLSHQPLLHHPLLHSPLASQAQARITHSLPPYL